MLLSSSAIARVRHRAAAALAAGLVLSAIAAPLPASAAAPIDVTTFQELNNAAQVCMDGDVVRFAWSGTLYSGSGSVLVQCDITLDLNGKALLMDFGSVVISPGQTLTIRDSTPASAGFLYVNPVTSGAGIYNRGATLVVESGYIEAHGGFGGAGIGSHDYVGANGDPWGGTVDIRGGHVFAEGGYHAAGIGGGEGDYVGGRGGTVTVSGDAVVVAIAGDEAVAIAGDEAAAIGGASGSVKGGAGGTLSIGAGATVYAAGLRTVGAGAGGTDFGSLLVEGTLVLDDEGVLELADRPGVEAAVGPGGLIRGGSISGSFAIAGDPRVGSDITGAGQLFNQGTIALSTDRVLASDHVEVTGNNSLVTFDRVSGADEQVRVFAPDFASGYRTFPTPIAGHAWLRPDESVFAAATALHGDETVVERVPPVVVGNFAELVAATGTSCVPLAGYLVRLSADLGPVDSDLPIACDLELDLAGHALDLGDGSVKLGAGTTLAVTDSSHPSTGALSATGGPGEAAIRTSGATLVVSSGTVTAAGGDNAAGIGGDAGASGGTVSVDGGIVTASGWNAIGHGLSGTSFGTVSVAGTLRLPSGELRMLDSAPGAEVTLDAGGSILGTVADPTIGVRLSGAGQVANGGVIALAADRVLGDGVVSNTIEVTGNHYLLAPDGTPAQAQRVFAPSVATGYRSLPATPARSGYDFAGWFSQSGGSGVSIGMSTTLSPVSTVMTPGDRGAAEVALFPSWLALPPAPQPGRPSATAPHITLPVAETPAPSPTAAATPSATPEPTSDPGDPEPTPSDDLPATGTADGPAELPIGWLILGGFAVLAVAGLGILIFRRLR